MVQIGLFLTGQIGPAWFLFPDIIRVILGSYSKGICRGESINWALAHLHFMLSYKIDSYILKWKGFPQIQATKWSLLCNISLHLVSCSWRHKKFFKSITYRLVFKQLRRTRGFKIGTCTWKLLKRKRKGLICRREYVDVVLSMHWKRVQVFIHV